MSGGVGASHRTTGRARRARLDCIPSNMAKRHGLRTPVVLIVLDGWGFRPGREGNAVELGDTPTWHRLWARAPRTLLDASGLAVGLPEGQIGNSERSEERRVGKECRSRWSPSHSKINMNTGSD